MLTLITLAPVCTVSYMMHTMLHSERLGGVTSLLKLMLKDSQTPDPQSMHHSTNSAQQNYFKI